MAKRPYDTRYWKDTLRARILRRDHNTCQVQYPDICLTQASAVDHIIPWQGGGPWYEEWNLRAVCTPCNSRRTHTPDPPRHQPSRNW